MKRAFVWVCWCLFNLLKLNNYRKKLTCVLLRPSCPQLQNRSFVCILYVLVRLLFNSCNFSGELTLLTPASQSHSFKRYYAQKLKDLEAFSSIPAESVMFELCSDSEILPAAFLLYSTSHGFSPPRDAMRISRAFISAIICYIYRCWLRIEIAMKSCETPSIKKRMNPPMHACLNATEVPPLIAKSPPVTAPAMIAFQGSSFYR